MERATLGFRIYEIWQILERFAGTFHRAQTLKLAGVKFSVGWPAKDRSNMRNIGKKYLSWDHSKTHTHT